MAKRRLYSKTFWWVLGIGVAVFLVLCILGGEVFNWYDSLPWFDKALHFVSGAFFAIIGFAIGYKMARAKPKFIALFAFCFSVTISVLWEFYEFFMDSTFGTNMLRWQDKDTSARGLGAGLTDTMWDLILGTLAALITCFVGYLWLKRKARTTPDEAQCPHDAQC